MSVIAPSLASPAAARRPSFNTLPLAIGVFCLLWSFAFVAGKIGVTDCPPLILLAARFLLAGVLIFRIALLRGEGWSLSRRDVAIFAVLGIANNALYLGLGGLIVSANPVFTAVALFLGESLT